MPDETGVELAVRRYLASSILFDDASRVPADLALLTGRVDSIALKRLMTFLEEEFDIELDDDDVVERNFSTPHDIALLVCSKLS